MGRTFGSVDEARAAIGEEVGPGESLVVDQERINLFADATGDHQWIHVDPERAKDGPYGTTIAHGYLTLSLLPVLGAGLLDFAFGGARINYGVNKVRFPSPVPVGSTLSATATLLDVTENPSGAVATIKYVVTAQGAAKPACVAESLVVIAP
ncbi:MaoC family dehydratase [Gordonia sp. (in: high G+C Gram-positive bacteria)]|uniref:MaoC family dehydratase n=1 Tax=Gordonia sp. (in: high G+C Gram-positive bacteria) TaxID=84139 RepID=UPI0039E482E2